MTRILVVEDEPAISTALQDDLELEGYEVKAVSNGIDAVRIALAERFDVVILDIMLPGKSGYDVCRELRKQRRSVPIIMLTAKSNESEKVLGLEMGADDYVTKPFSPLELRARIKALLRRTSTTATTLEAGPLALDLENVVVRCHGERVDLTRLEFKLLSALMQHEGHVLSRDRLLDIVWGSNIVVTDRAVDTHIANIRKKLAVDVIESVRGMGYRFAV